MASVCITQFAGLMPEVHGGLIPQTNAQIAHNCILRDGKLRPMAKWVEVDRRGGDMWKGIAYDKRQGKPVVYWAYDPIALDGPPFAEGYTIGVTNDLYGLSVLRFPTASPNTSQPVGLSGDPIYASVTYTRSYDSIKPVNRIYGATRVRKYDNRAEEGPLWVLPGQDARETLYEGYLVTIELTADGSDGTTHFRLYRTITGLDTGQSTTNDLDTNWHLVDELPSNVIGPRPTYIDGASATAAPLDVNYSQSFHAPLVQARYAGLTDGGWFVIAAEGGEIQVSERYLHHAWPAENQFRIPTPITDMVVRGDNAFFGTENYPYIMALSFGEKALQGKIDRYGERHPCRRGTMAATAYGAMYASAAGLVSLTRDGMEVVTRDLGSTGTVFNVREINALDPNTGNTMRSQMKVAFGETGYGFYDAGKYYGFCYAPPQYTPGGS